MPTFPTISSGSVVTEADVLAQDMLEVEFRNTVKNDELLQSTDAYTITPLDGGIAVNVVNVKHSGEFVTNKVWLIVTTPTVGKLYSITFQNIYLTNGTVVTPTLAKFVGRNTKQDSIIRSLPKMYDTTPDSVLRAIIQAIGREDDLIGGSRNDRIFPLIVPPDQITQTQILLYSDDTTTNEPGAVFVTKKTLRLVSDSDNPVISWRVVLSLRNSGAPGSVEARVQVGADTSLVLSTASAVETIYNDTIIKTTADDTLLTVNFQARGTGGGTIAELKYTDIYAIY